MFREYTLQRAPHLTAINIDCAPESNERQLVDSRDSLRHDEGDDLAAVLAIGSEIAVGGEHNCVVKLLCHPDETCVREAHGSIVIATHESKRLHLLIGEGKIDCNNGAFQQSAQSLFAATRALQEEEAFRDYRFTSDERLLLGLEVCARPGMMLIALSQRSDNRAAIDDDGFGHSFSDAPCSLTDRREADPYE
jgi:hypothetical protein